MMMIEGAERDLLIDLSRKAFTASEPELAPLRDGDWAGFKLADYQGRLVLSGADLKVLMPAEIGRLRTFIEMMDARNHPAVVALADGSTVHAQLAHLKHVRDDAELSLYNWSWATAAAPRSTWGATSRPVRSLPRCSKRPESSWTP